MIYYAGLDVSVKETQKRAVVALRGRLAVTKPSFAGAEKTLLARFAARQTR